MLLLSHLVMNRWNPTYKTWRGTGLNLITRSPQSEIDLPLNDIHSRHQYERRKTIKVLLGDEPFKKNKYQTNIQIFSSLPFVLPSTLLPLIVRERCLLSLFLRRHLRISVLWCWIRLWRLRRGGFGDDDIRIDSDY